MTQILYLSAVATLGIVFALAGWGKLMAREETRKAVIDLGAPASLAEPVARVLPYLELTIAVLLLLAGFRWYAATASMIMLAMFLAATSRAYVRGRDVNCNCLGRFASSRIGVSALVRNIVLVLLSAIIVAGSSSTPVDAEGVWSLWLPVGIAAVAGLSTLLVLMWSDRSSARPPMETSAESPFRWPLEELVEPLAQSRSATKL